MIASPNWLIRKYDFDLLDGFRGLVYPEDYHLVLKWYRAGFQVHTVPEVTLLWREHPKRTSRNSENYSQEAFFQLKISAFLQYDWNKEPIVIWGKNRKSKMISNILRDTSIDHEIHDLNHYQNIQHLDKSQLLVSVYPESAEKKAIVSYLNKIGRKEGKNWWWL